MTNPLLQTDFYKVSHMLLYPEGTQYVYETLTPRKNSYFPWNDKMTVFGYELFFHRLHERFQKEFFDLTVEEAVDPVVDTIAEVLSQDVADKVKPQFVKLHELGYLPLRVQSLPEGVLVPMQVPVLTIENTDPDFYWLPGYLETSLLSDTFVTSTVASTTRQFKVSGYKYALKTGAISVLGKAIEAKLFLESKKQLSDITDVDESIDYTDFQFHDFSERGQHGNEAALLSGIAHLTSSHGTDIIQAVNYVRNNYQDKGNLVGVSVLATEHSVMEAVYADVSSDAQFGFASSTQVLTPSGWSSLNDIDDTDEVFQVDENGFGDFTPILKLDKYPYKGEMIHWTGYADKINSLVSPDSYISVVRPSRTDLNEEKIEKLKSKVANSGNRYTYQKTSAPKIDGIHHLTPLDQLRIAFQADGSKTQRYAALVFSFSKERKIERLKDILGKLGYNYRTTFAPSSPNQPNRKDQIRFSIDLPGEVVVDNDLSWVDLSNKSHIWLKEFLTEISQWDSSNAQSHFQYFSNNPLNIDVVERAAIMAGYYARKGLATYDNPNHKTTYSVTVAYSNILHGKLRQKESVEYDGEIVSISVPSGNILTKYGSATMVLPDNTENYNEQSFISQLKSYETLLKNNPTGILSVVSDTYDYWEVINDVLPALKDLIMSRDGKLVVRPDTSDQYFSGFSDDTEVLTKNGWVPITSIKEDTLIGTVDKGNKLVFSKPVKLSRSQYSGNMVHFRDNFGKLDLLVTPEYELLINQANKKGTIKERKVMANTVAKRGNAGQKHNRSAELNNVGVSLSNEERLNIAFQADGDKMEYGMASNKMKFQFSKQRKLSRLSTILDALGYDYKVSRSSRAKGNSAEEYKFTITLPSGFKKQPTFSWVVPELFLKGSKWAKEFIEEVSHWDASIRGEGRIKYDSTIKINSDAVELVALMAGYGSYTSVHQDNRKEYFLDTHTVNILKDNSIGGQSRVKENLVVTDMNITSVKVTTGKLLIKRNNGYLVANDNSNNMVGVETMLVDTLQSMWDTFGGTVDENGIKVLDSHIGLLHGEGVSLDNIDEYFEAITNAGYSPENIVFGVGAYVYSVQASRDSFGQALKATSVTIKGEEKKVFKDPKTVSESFKKSLKGRVRVVMGDKGYEVQDDLLFTEVGKDNELKTIYEPSQGKTESLVTPFEVIRKRIDMSAVIEGATKVAKD